MSTHYYSLVIRYTVIAVIIGIPIVMLLCRPSLFLIFFRLILISFNLISFYFSFIPAALDMNFWRYYWANSAGTSVSASNSDFGIFYNLLLGFGFRI